MLLPSEFDVEFFKVGGTESAGLSTSTVITHQWKVWVKSRIGYLMNPIITPLMEPQLLGKVLYTIPSFGSSMRIESMATGKGKEKMHSTAERQMVHVSEAGSKGLLLLADLAGSIVESDGQCFMDKPRGEGNANVPAEKLRLTRIRQLARFNNNLTKVIHKSHKKAKRVCKSKPSGGQNHVEIPIQEVQPSRNPYQGQLGHEHSQGHNHVGLPVQSVRLVKIRQQARLPGKHYQGLTSHDDEGEDQMENVDMAGLDAGGKVDLPRQSVDGFNEDVEYDKEISLVYSSESGGEGDSDKNSKSGSTQGSASSDGFAEQIDVSHGHDDSEVRAEGGDDMVDVIVDEPLSMMEEVHVQGVQETFGLSVPTEHVDVFDEYVKRYGPIVSAPPSKLLIHTLNFMLKNLLDIVDGMVVISFEQVSAEMMKDWRRMLHICQSSGLNVSGVVQRIEALEQCMLSRQKLRVGGVSREVIVADITTTEAKIASLEAELSELGRQLVARRRDLSNLEALLYVPDFRFFD